MTKSSPALDQSLHVGKYSVEFNMTKHSHRPDSSLKYRIWSLCLKILVCRAILRKTINMVEWFFWGPSFTNEAIFKLSFVSGRIPFMLCYPSEEVNLKLLMINMVALRNLLSIFQKVWLYFQSLIGIFHTRAKDCEAK